MTRTNDKMTIPRQVLPRIAFLFWAGERFGGAERRYARLAEYIQNNKLAHVSVFGRSSFYRSLRQVGITLFNCEIHEIEDPQRGKTRKALGELWKCFRKLGAEKIDHVHICANPGVVSFLYSLFPNSTPKYSISMNALLFSQNASFFQKKLFLPFSVARASSVDCLGPRYKQQLMKYAWKGSESKAHVAPCSFTASWDECSSTKRDIDVTFAARFVPGKGLDLLDAALGEMTDLNLHICGSGPISVNLRNAKAYHTDRVYDVLCRSKIFVSLQSDDNYPSQSVLEAMAAECAIIATDVGDTRMFLSESNAIMIPPRPEALRNAVTKLLNNEALRKELAANAKAALVNNHTIDNYSDYFLQKIIRIPSDRKLGIL